MIKLLRQRKFLCGTALVASILALGVGQSVLQKRAEAQGSTVQAPVFEVDPLWPKPLPNNWLLGWTIGIWVDELDHIWVIHRGAIRSRRRTTFNSTPFPQLPTQACAGEAGRATSVRL